MAVGWKPEVSIGNLLSIGTVVVGLSVGYATIAAELKSTESRITALEEYEARIRAVEIDIASQSSDLANIQKGIDEIKARLEALAEGQR